MKHVVPFSFRKQDGAKVFGKTSHRESKLSQARGIPTSLHCKKNRKEL
jgi:hypothetical protein